MIKLHVSFLACVAAVALAGCSSAQDAGEGFGSSEGSAVLVSGTVSTDLVGRYGRPAQTSAPCDDLANVEVTGNSVKIADASGETVGLATLMDEGPQGLTFDGQDLPAGFQTIETGTCQWSFSVNDFSSESDFFSISVDGVGGAVDVSRADLLAGPDLKVPAGPR